MYIYKCDIEFFHKLLVGVMLKDTQLLKKQFDLMTKNTPEKLKDGDECIAVGGVHAEKPGIARDINTSKTGHITITVAHKKWSSF